MSNIPNYNPNNMTSSELRSEHHPHDSSEPLPGAAGGIGRAPDYGAENMNTTGSGFGVGAQPRDELGEFGNSGLGTATGVDYDPSANDLSASAPGRGEMFMATEGTTQGGTGVGQRGYEPAYTAKPGVGDKITGGAQKLAGKVMNNPGMQQKGELRETSGKSALGRSGNTDL